MRDTRFDRSVLDVHAETSGQTLGGRSVAVWLLGWILSVVGIGLTGSVAFAQGSALFIDEKGNVGIGTDQPHARLEVAGRIRDAVGFVMPVGTILPFAGNKAPDGWLLCDGSQHGARDYADLYSVVGTTYGAGGDGTFRVPDLRGRGLMGLSGSGNFARLGQTGGAETHRLTVNEMPSHAHAVNDPGHQHYILRPVGDQNWSNGSGNTWWGYSRLSEATSMSLTGITIQSAGGNEAHATLDPYLTVNFIIKY